MLPKPIVMKYYFLLLLAAMSFSTASATEITGIVSNARTGEPIFGVGVQVQNTPLQAVTNEYGKYTMNLSDKDANEGILIFSFKGKKIAQRSIAPQSDFNIAVALESPAPPHAETLSGFKKGDWTMNFGGNVNAHYIYTSADNSNNVVQGNALLTTGATGVHSVQSGLLPTCLSFSATTVTKDSFTIAATIGLFAGTVSNAGLSYSDLDLRQTFLTVSKPTMGTFTFGRNFGLFGFDAIINDISLVGAGATALSVNPLNTTLGGIGYGYVYCDRLSQINYTTPNMSGFDATIGIFNPLNTSTLGIGTSYAGESGSARPGIHGKLKYSNGGFYGSASFINQSVKALTTELSATGFDVYAKYSASGFGIAGYYYNGVGLGTTALFYDGFVRTGATTGATRTSSGYYAQASYVFGKTKVGVNYGVSTLDKTTNDDVTMLKQHQRITVGVYQPLTGPLSLVAEFTNMQALSHDATKNTISNNAINVGVFLGF
jgi:hypothetical protein